MPDTVGQDDGAGAQAGLPLDSVDYVLSTTRAVRKRLDLERPVDPAVIAECLRLASQAPTGGNIQNWRFVVVTDPGIAGGASASTTDAAPSDYLAAGVARARTDQQRRVASSSVYLMENMARVPVHVLACVKGRPPGGENQAAAGFYGSVMPAVWSFALALRSRGLGSRLDDAAPGVRAGGRRVARHPGDVTQVALLPVAYTVGPGLQAGRATADRTVHLLEPVRRDRTAAVIKTG